MSANNPYRHSYDTGLTGPRLLVTGAVHGNERCGPTAIFNIMAQLHNNQITLKRGSLVTVPVANPPAFAAGKRHVGRDLNRDLHPVTNPNSVDDHIRNALCAELSACDVLLDLHSLHCSRVPFAYLGPYNQAERDFALSLGVHHFVQGWQDAYKNSNHPIIPTQSTGTTEYARANGAIGVTLECGNHYDPDIANVAVRAIVGAMNNLGMVNTVSDEIQTFLDGRPVFTDKVSCVQMDSVVYQLKDGHLVGNRSNFDPIAKGDVLARHHDRTTIKADKDGFIIMPDDRMTKAKPHGEPPEEWFYTGTASSFNGPKPA